MKLQIYYFGVFIRIYFSILKGEDNLEAIFRTLNSIFRPIYQSNYIKFVLFKILYIYIYISYIIITLYIK